MAVNKEKSIERVCFGVGSSTISKGQKNIQV